MRFSWNEVGFITTFINMRKLISTLILVTFCLVVKAQFMLGEGVDDILNIYQNKKDFRLSVLRTPKGTVVPKFRITSTVQMQDTGDSENSLITYKEIKTDKLYTFYLINDRCITFQHTYKISKRRQIIDKLNKLYSRIEAEGIASDRWTNSDNSMMISIIPYESLNAFDVQYSLK